MKLRFTFTVKFFLYQSHTIQYTVIQLFWKESNDRFCGVDIKLLSYFIKTIIQTSYMYIIIILIEVQLSKLKVSFWWTSIKKPTNCETDCHNYFGEHFVAFLIGNHQNSSVLAWKITLQRKCL